MRYWLLALQDDEFTEQQAYEAEAVSPSAALPEDAADGDEVALAGPEGVFALGEVVGGAVAYRRRLEASSPTAETAKANADEATGWIGLNPDAWEDLVRSLPAPERRSDWLVTLSMPIEAVDKAEAVRQFWSYIRSLGPKELPTFVSPYGRELEGTSFLLGVEHEQDPEE
ncbi:hypothetical protein [Glycomyces harbinensis]|uniref:Uncharacterized protein n=1 Tax=Glycomyces harbinensis TaxID=58114 RepID=A0A1G6TN56_9ACTN|nr:hypothetical protein [Glycomyces harbinensis]SDD29916.1 hypothetical protein SAMN05216270_10340 [Glycomyces harbinensis]